MSFRYTLRLTDGSDAGEIELEQPASVGETVHVSETRRMGVHVVFPTERIEEFVDAPRFGFLVVEELNE
jgi:hypothetical protein